jgi:hypothetical protein
MDIIARASALASARAMQGRAAYGQAINAICAVLMSAGAREGARATRAKRQEEARQIEAIRIRYGA